MHVIEAHHHAIFFVRKDVERQFNCIAKTAEGCWLRFHDGCPFWNTGDVCNLQPSCGETLAQSRFFDGGQKVNAWQNAVAARSIIGVKREH